MIFTLTIIFFGVVAVAIPTGIGILSHQQPGTGKFSNHIKLGLPLVDKSLFTVNLFTEGGSKALSIYRPRQLGKSLALDMAAEYFGQFGDGSLFKNLKIDAPEYKDFQNEYKNKFPIIFIDFSSVNKVTNFTGAKNAIHTSIMQVFFKFQWLKLKPLNHVDTAAFDKILSNKASDSEFDESIRFLSEILETYHKRRPFILIDEMDTPLIIAAVHDFLEDMECKIVSFYESTFISNHAYSKGILCGVHPIFESRRFLINKNIRSFTIKDQEFQTDFGFTKEEISSLIEKNFPNKDLVSTLNEITEWYDEMKVGELQVYKPESVLNFLRQKENCKVNQTSLSSTQLFISDNLVLNHGLLPQLNFQILTRNLTLIKILGFNFELESLMEYEQMLWQYFFYSGIITVDNLPSIKNEGTVTIKMSGRESQELIGDLLQRSVLKFELPDYEQLLQALNDYNVDIVHGIVMEYTQRAGIYLFGKNKKVNMEQLASYMYTILTEFKNQNAVRSSIDIQKDYLKMSFYPKSHFFPLEFTFQVQPNWWDKTWGMFKEKDAIDTGKEILYFSLSDKVTRV